MLVCLYKLENQINQLIQEILIMWCYMILKKEEECNMSQVLILQCHVLLENSDWKLKEKLKNSITATLDALPTYSGIAALFYRWPLVIKG